MSEIIANVDKLLKSIFILSEMKRSQRTQIFESIASHLQKQNGAECFLVGGFLIDILLPDEFIEGTQVMPKKQCENWCLTVSSILCQESSKATQNETTDGNDLADLADKISFNYIQAGKTIKVFKIEAVEFSVKHDFVVTSIGQDNFKLSPNNLTSIFLAAVFEEFNELNGNKNLLKRSLLLIKVWCYYEARKYCTVDLSTIFSHDAMLVMTLCVFTSNRQLHRPVDSPLRALRYFLEIMADVNWRNEQVTACGIEPLSSFSNPSISNLDRENPFLVNLHNIVAPYRNRFEDNFAEGGESSWDTTYSEDSRMRDVPPRRVVPDPSRRPANLASKNSSNNSNMCEIRVLDPVLPSRNICAQKHHDKESLRHVFRSGLRDLAELFRACSDANNQVTLSSSITVGEISSTSSIHSEPNSNNFSVNSVNMFFPLTVEKILILSEGENTNNMNVWQYPGLFGASPMKPANNVTKLMETSSFPEMSQKLFQHINFIIRHSEMVASTKLNADVIIHLVIQILTQHGPLPIGEIGKQLQLKTGNNDIPKIIKRNFQGLKKFISAYPNLFFFDTNHNFNPKVHMNATECNPLLTSLGSQPYQFSENPQVHQVLSSPPQQQSMLRSPQIQPMNSPQLPNFRTRDTAISYYSNANSGVSQMYNDAQQPREQREWDLHQQQQQPPQHGHRMSYPFHSPGNEGNHSSKNRHGEFLSDSGRTNSRNYVNTVTPSAPNNGSFFDDDFDLADTEDIDDFHHMNSSNRINPPRYPPTTSLLYANNPSQPPYPLGEHLHNPAAASSSGQRPVYTRASSNIVMTSRERNNGTQYASIVKDFNHEPPENYYHGGKFN